MNKCIIFGGGTFKHSKCHLALAAPAFGTTARVLLPILEGGLYGYSVELILTKMADHRSSIVTNEDLSVRLEGILKDYSVKVIVFNAAVCDFTLSGLPPESRLSSASNYTNVVLEGVKEKLLASIKRKRSDIVVVGFKTTAGETEDVQKIKARSQMQNSGVDIVLANDTISRNNLIVTNKSGVKYGSRHHLLSTLPVLIKAEMEESLPLKGVK